LVPSVTRNRRICTWGADYHWHHGVTTGDTINRKAIMASFSERSGAVRVTVRLPGGGRETATFDTRAEAERWADDLERKKAVGQLKSSASSGVLVSDLFEAYDLAVASKTDSAKWNSLRINKWLTDPLASIRVSQVTTHEINEWITRRGKSVSGATVNRELNLMSGAFTYAVKDRRWIAVNPCHGARRPEKGRPRGRRLLTPAEVEMLCVSTGFATDPELRTLTSRVGACFLLALETGMRSGEILRLRPVDYHRDDKVIHVAALEVGGRKGSRSGRSTRSASRDVPLTARAVELLDLLLRRPPQPGYIVGMTDQQRDALWRKAVKQSTVEDLHFHDTKHEAATRLSQFLDVLALSHAIGTKDIRLLRDTYYNHDAKRSAALLPNRLAA